MGIVLNLIQHCHCCHSSSQKARVNYLSYGMKIWTDLSSVLSQCTRLMDRRTDGQTAFSSLDRVCIPCSAVKTAGIRRDSPVGGKVEELWRKGFVEKMSF